MVGVEGGVCVCVCVCESSEIDINEQAHIIGILNVVSGDSGMHAHILADTIHSKVKCMGQNQTIWSGHHYSITVLSLVLVQFVKALPHTVCPSKTPELNNSST